MAPRVSERFVSFGLDGEPEDARNRNGEYHGTCPVRTLPPGVCGLDLRLPCTAPKVGQVWIRGEQRVRVVKTGLNRVTFRELTNGGRLRSVPRVAFLRSSHRMSE